MYKETNFDSNQILEVWWKWTRDSCPLTWESSMETRMETLDMALKELSNLRLSIPSDSGIMILTNYNFMFFHYGIIERLGFVIVLFHLPSSDTYEKVTNGEFCPKFSIWIVNNSLAGKSSWFFFIDICISWNFRLYFA